MYSLEDLGVVKDMEYSVPAAINTQGYVTGTAYKGAESCAFHYDYVKKLMEDAGGLNSRGFAISSTGSIAGGNIVVGDAVFVMSIMPVSHAAMFKSGYVTDLGVLPGQVFSRANGINVLGQVVGYSGRERDSSESRAFLWSNQTGMIDIGTLGGAYAQAYAINDAGVITGASQTQGMGPMVTTHAFIYRVPDAPYRRYSRMVDLGVLGGLSSYGTAINSYNHVAGYSTISNQRRACSRVLARRCKDDRSRIARRTRKPVGWRYQRSSGYQQLRSSCWIHLSSLSPVVGEMPIQQVAFSMAPSLERRRADD